MVSGGAGTIRRVFFGQFVRPASETGTGLPRVEPILGYVVELPGGYLLLDTGMGTPDAETEAHYSPDRVVLEVALDSVGVKQEEIQIVVNCHLHFDHCGGNPIFAGVPIIVQKEELEAARMPDYTLPELVDFPGAAFTELDGEAELVDGLVWVIPTPGHSPGHQSLVVRTPQGNVVCAGQSHPSAHEYASSLLSDKAHETDPNSPAPSPPEWFGRLQRFSPRRVLFAHDLAILDGDVLTEGVVR